MPRQARKKSESGIYHIMLRGINKQQTFEDDEDCQKYLQILKECKAVSEFKLFAYCLMGNHIHLLIQLGKEPIDLIFKRIGSRYVYWYNLKYRRTGHLFQDRYKSEPVEADSYFLTVVRYIHQNPVKAGMCANISEYAFSSYHEYENDVNQKLVNVDYALSLVSRTQLLEFFEETNNDICLEISDTIRLNDEEAKEIIKSVSNCAHSTQVQNLDINQRNNVIKILKENGLSIRQISRLTGISFNIVRKY